MAQPQTKPSKRLADRLGMKPGMRVGLISAPAGYAGLLGGVPDGAVLEAARDGAVYPMVHYFVADAAALALGLDGALARVAPGGMLWVSWPKKASPLFRDLTDVLVRDFVLPSGFVDVKVCAVDATWSGLKFLRRVTAK